MIFGLGHEGCSLDCGPSLEGSALDHGFEGCVVIGLGFLVCGVGCGQCSTSARSFGEIVADM